ncbi:MAG: hypothetical protein NC180_00515 [Muribaculaceae bacterium]|nr:ABC transporter permease [Roseburia sp.]MCM1432216.1 hypothetical protein [Muribaculaceae bacterium]MCM1491697.1 hypothetical protein [Muribaculaceae bacterium]
MKNPLRKRFLRELKSEFGKYLVIFLLMTGSIALVSGFVVAGKSLLAAYNESFEKYNVEDGHFRTGKELDDGQKRAVEKGISLCELFWVEEEMENDSTLRIFADRKQMNTVCLLSGEMPGADWELGLDRMYAENNGIRVGDTLSDGTHSFTVSGLVALPDYSCLFQNNSDSMFDSVKFGVGVVAPGTFDALADDGVRYVYAWKYDEAPENEAEEKEQADALMKTLARETELKDFVPQYLNQAINFTGEDMEGDSTMMVWLLYIITVILAFVFGVTIANTISREAGVIGTLRASGYTRGELIRHYMAMPLLVTLVSALVGNLLGYTVLKDYGAKLYYGSYSLTTYQTLWSPDTFYKTTLVPLVLMLLVNFVVLSRKLKLPPLKFLRRDLSGKKRKKTLHLTHRIGFFTRFRLRIIFQNMSNYLVLFVGILFANLILFFGMIFPSVLEHYNATIGDHMLCKYQYLLEAPLELASGEESMETLAALLAFSEGVETENGDAEKFSAYTLKTLGEKFPAETVTLYGVEMDSRYLQADFSDGKIYISSAYAEKYRWTEGDIFTLKEPYGEESYEFQADGIYDYEGGLNIFMSREKLNEMFDLNEEYFSGYFSDSEITDIDSQYIATVIGYDELTKISRQLTVSMGGMMKLVEAFALLVFVILVYLLSKVIIEKNAQSISMAKILGYTPGEITRLYVLSTSIVVVLCLLVSLPIEVLIMEVLFREVMLQMISGWIAFWLDPMLLVKMFVMGVATYMLVAALEYRRVRRVPMEEALKNVE